MMLACQNIAFRYPSQDVLIPAFSGEFPEGKITAVIGKNGCGKSTLLHLLAGLLIPTAGTVELSGKPLLRLSLKERARQIALMSQTPEIPRDIPVGDFLLCGRYPCRTSRRENRDAAEKIMDECGILPLRGAFLPELSGGERQKVFLAFSLVKEPSVLLLDEPFSALDPAAAKSAAELLIRFCRQRKVTVVMVLHDLALAQRTADHLLGMRRGNKPFFLPAGTDTAETVSALYA